MIYDLLWLCGNIDLSGEEKNDTFFSKIIIVLGTKWLDDFWEEVGEKKANAELREDFFCTNRFIGGSS